MVAPDLLNSFERQLLSKLTDGDHPLLEGLRKQAGSVTSVRRNASSFGIEVEFEVAESADRIEPADFCLSDVGFGLYDDDETGQAVLHIKDGCLRKLAAHLIFEMWPSVITPGGMNEYSACPECFGPYYVGYTYDNVADKRWGRLPNRDMTEISRALAT
jgi:hypothetical protein